MLTLNLDFLRSLRIDLYPHPICKDNLTYHETVLSDFTQNPGAPLLNCLRLYVYFKCGISKSAIFVTPRFLIIQNKHPL